jgi:hypothetical protein
MPHNFRRTLSIMLTISQKKNQRKIVKKPDFFVKRDVYSSRNVAIDVVTLGNGRCGRGQVLLCGKSV